MRIKELMTPDPVVVPPDMKVEPLVRLLADRHLSGVFVVDAAGAPLGVVTEADLVRRLAPQDEEGLGWLARLAVDADRAARRYARAHGRCARDVMSPTIVSVHEDAPPAEAAQLMCDRRIRRVAVLRDGRVVGVVSRADLLKAVAAQPDRLGTESDDARIRRTIVAEMRRQPWADTELTAVTVSGGVVSFEGYCRSNEVRRALRVLAERVDGVRSVEDRLTVGVPPSSSLYPGI
ncbi:CBS domain-containing protein [Falsiroseomonas oryziterrae]|uniref:CBS domain-containing protein n=1 Tax=Falsiroseomonas oryziterrae TaxID=2911368 RepID=UPI001F46B6C5|nr:CBS domain-containing protein [Roseomonas sp. NPKOSM-4]